MRIRAIRRVVGDVSMDHGAACQVSTILRKVNNHTRRNGVTTQKLDSFKDRLQGRAFSDALRPQFSGANFGRNTSHPEAFRDFSQFLQGKRWDGTVSPLGYDSCVANLAQFIIQRSSHSRRYYEIFTSS